MTEEFTKSIALSILELNQYVTINNREMVPVKVNGGYVPQLTNFFDDIVTRDFFTHWPMFSNLGTSMPKVNILESDDEFKVEVAAPGMKKEDFKLELDNNTLHISSESKTEKEEKEDDYCRKEFSYQSFERSFELPTSVNAEKIKAQYVDGMLKLAIPKAEEAKKKPLKTIKIN